MRDDGGINRQAILSTRVESLMDAVDTRCQWFALCTNEAVTYVEHPVIGPVPTCQRCAQSVTPAVTESKPRNEVTE